MADNLLGKNVQIPQKISPEVLFGISRSEARNGSNIKGPINFSGHDVWNCYELSWLDSVGKPRAATCRLTYDCNSPRIVESKSLKLYLYSLNSSSFADDSMVKETILGDVGNVVGTNLITIELDSLLSTDVCQPREPLGVCLDALSPSASVFVPTAELLTCSDNSVLVSEILYSNLFRSLCPVTSQPDWGSVSVKYKGNSINRESLLAYLISYRNHQGFHEDCCERIFTDIMRHCSPSELSVMCNFLRRGGIDITPIRSTPNAEPLTYHRTTRQ